MSMMVTAISSVLLTFSRKKSILMYTRKAELSAQLTMEKAYYIFNDNAKKGEDSVDTWSATPAGDVKQFYCLITLR